MGDTDKLKRTQLKTMRMATAAGIPSAESEPLQPGVPEQRHGLKAEIEDLENVLRYMGALHPLRQNTMERLANLKDLLRRVAG